MASVYSVATTKICGIDMTAWEHMVNQLNNLEESSEPIQVNKEQYEAWKKEALFDGLRGLRYGQSFCNSFGITDNILYYKVNHTDADEYIRKIYIA